MDTPTLLFFIAICLMLFSACEDPGIVGARFLENGSELVSRNLEPAAINQVSSDGYTGKLRTMAIGHYNDPLFGEVQAIGYIKPAISSSTVSSIDDEETMRLQLVFSESVYGDTTSQAGFDLYRVTQFWRGNELRIGDNIAWDSQDLIGSFTASPRDTVFVDLDQAWIDDYAEFLESEDENRLTDYQETFFGLAIVPTSGDSKILFPDIRPAGDEDPSNTDYARFVIDNDDPDVERLYLPALDWGTTIHRTVANSRPLTIHNILDSILEIDPGITEERLGSKNLANVELVLFQDRETLSNSLPMGHVRPEVNRARIHLIDNQKKSDQIFNYTPDYITERDTSDNSFRFNLTPYANSILYGSPPEGKFYLSIESINGLLYSTLFHSDTASELFRPKIVISVINKPDN